MERWFAKYPKKLKEKHALKSIKKQAELALEVCENDGDYLIEVSKLHDMVEDFLEAKNFLSKTLPSPRA